MEIARIPVIIALLDSPQFGKCSDQFLNLVQQLFQHVDLCQSSVSRLCEGNLGIPRVAMPQLSPETLQSYQDSMTKAGNTTLCQRISPLSLVPIQNEINTKKVTDLINSFCNQAYNPCRAPILVASNNQILDGHHRWAACYFLKNPIDALKIEIGAPEQLKLLRQFPGVYSSDFSTF